MDHSCETIGFWKSPASPVLVDKLMNGETIDDFKHPKPPKRLPCPRFVACLEASFKTPLIISLPATPLPVQAYFTSRYTPPMKKPTTTQNRHAAQIADTHEYDDLVNEVLNSDSTNENDDVSA
jgi:hypothetical protein